MERKSKAKILSKERRKKCVFDWESITTEWDEIIVGEEGGIKVWKGKNGGSEATQGPHSKAGEVFWKAVACI